MSSSIVEICEAARDVLASAIGARVKYASLPTGQIPTLPAAVVAYQRTELEYANHNARTGEGKQTASGQKRTHYGTLFAILSITSDVAAEAYAQERAAQSIMDAFAADMTLYRTADAVARFRLSNVRPMRDETDGQVTARVDAEWEAIEL